MVVGSAVSTLLGAIANSDSVTGTGGIAINVQCGPIWSTIDQEAGLISGNVLSSANADVLNIRWTISGNIAGRGGACRSTPGHQAAAAQANGTNEAYR
jgi:hypothetical protein